MHGSLFWWLTVMPFDEMSVAAYKNVGGVLWQGPANFKESENISLYSGKPAARACPQSPWPDT